jgi:hypothetical protein
MCERVKKLCLPVLQEFNFPWPDTLSCEKFPPANNMDHMCMDGGIQTGQGHAHLCRATLFLNFLKY